MSTELLSSLAQINPLTSFANSAYKKFSNSNSASSDAKEVRESFSNQGPVNSLYNLLQMIILIFALYLAFKCAHGFDIGQVLLACCCSPCYIAYRLAVPCDEF